jgi:hypothetical protein
MASPSMRWRGFGFAQFVAVAILFLVGLSYRAETQVERDYSRMIQEDIPEFAEAVSSPDRIQLSADEGV